MEKLQSISWNIETLPEPQSVHSECGTYYIVKVKGYNPPTMAMYLTNDKGETGWYTNYYSKITRQIEKWASVE